MYKFLSFLDHFAYFILIISSIMGLLFHFEFYGFFVSFSFFMLMILIRMCFSDTVVAIKRHFTNLEK